MKPNIYIKPNHSFAFEIIIQIIRMKMNLNENVSDEIKDLLRIVQFDNQIKEIPYNKLDKKIRRLVIEIKKVEFPKVEIFKRFSDKELTFRLKLFWRPTFPIILNFQKLIPEQQNQNFLTELNLKFLIKKG